MNILLELFTLLVFLSVFAGVYAARAFSSRQRRAEQAAARLAELRAEMRAVIAPVQATEQRLLLRDDVQFTPVERTGWRRWWAEVQGNLEALGWRRNLKLRIALVAIVALVGGMLIGRRAPAPWLFGGIGAVLLFVLIAVMSYRNALSKYLDGLRNALPEAIDALTRTARAGVPLHSTFAIVADHLRSPLATELRLIDRWLQLGVPLRSAMIDSAKRVPIQEYRFFAVILIINQETGGRLGDTMDRLSATLRARAELKLKVMARTSEARASAKIVASLVPAVLAYMYVNAPRDFEFLLTDPAGIKVSIYAVCSVCLGLLITHLMVRRVA